MKREIYHKDKSILSLSVFSIIKTFKAALQYLLNIVILFNSVSNLTLKYNKTGKSVVSKTWKKLQKSVAILNHWNTCNFQKI